MKTIFAFLILIFSSLSIYATETYRNLVAENVISKWGYFTRKPPNSYEYKKLNKLPSTITIEYQTIRSKSPAPGQTDTYYYFTLSQECYPSKYKVIRRKLALSFFRDEKEYKLSFVNGNCIYITECAANFETFGEQPRIHKLFKKYMIKKMIHSRSDEAVTEFDKLTAKMRAKRE